MQRYSSSLLSWVLSSWTLKKTPSSRPFPLLELPIELRTMVYDHLLPPDPLYDYIAIKNCTGASTTFTSTCRQIYEESSNVLYGCRKHQIIIYHHGSIRFLGREWNEDEDDLSSVTPQLNRIHTLEILFDLLTKIENGPASCFMQDALIDFLNLTSHDHKLRKIEIFGPL